MSAKHTLEYFQNYILELDETITDEVTAKTRERLKIYRDGYYLRLLEVLSFDFSMFKRYVGASVFDRLGREYIDAHPSASVSILTFAFGFPDFLKKQAGILEDQLELAQFELVLEKARSVAIQDPFPVEQLRSITPDAWASLTFDLNPSAVQFESSYGGPFLWEALANDLPLPASDQTIEKWLIWGREGAAHFCALTSPLIVFFEAMVSGKCFGEVCERLCEQMPEEAVGEFAGRYLNQWIQDQIIVRFKVP